MTHEELMALPEIPRISFGVKTMPNNDQGQRVVAPVLEQPAQALYQTESDGVFVDATNIEWITGHIDGIRYRRKR